MITKSKKVYIKLRDDIPVLPGRDKEELNYKIGAFSVNGATGRGLTHEEEIKYLPKVLGISPSSPNWDAATDNYWNSISVRIPYPTGIQLEVGKNENGEPINISDYVLFKFAKKHRHVGASKEVVHKSKHIWFYIEDLEIENKKRKEIVSVKMEAYKLLTENQDQERFLTGILLVLGDKLNKPYLLESMDLNDKLSEVTQLVEENPKDFVEAANAPDLDFRTFLISAIQKGFLTRIPNTEIIMFGQDGETRELGSNYSEAILYLKAENNREFTKRLESKMNFSVTPKKKAEEVVV